MAKQIPNKVLYLALALITIQATGVLFMFDFPQIFEAILIQKMGINAYKVQLLYSLGAFPNLVSNMIVSPLVPKVGVGFIVLLFQCVNFTGVAITYLAVRMNSYYVMCVGRVFIGLSFDFCTMGVLLCCEKWFKGKILSISIGLARFMRTMSTSLSFYLLPKIFLSTRNLEDSAFSCVLFSFTIFCLTSIFSILDLKYDHILKNPETAKTQEEKKQGKVEEEFRKSVDEHFVRSKIESTTTTRAKPKEFEFKHLRYIPVKARYFMLYVFLVPNIYYQITNTGTDFLVTRFGLTYENAKNTLSLLPLVSAPLIPITSALSPSLVTSP